jgi:hypothetical protein
MLYITVLTKWLPKSLRADVYQRLAYAQVMPKAGFTAVLQNF